LSNKHILPRFVTYLVPPETFPLRRVPFAVHFCIWLCCEYLEHMCCETDEDMFCSTLSSLGNRRNYKTSWPAELSVNIFAAKQLSQVYIKQCQYMIKKKKGRGEIRLGYAEGMQDIWMTAAFCLPNLNIDIHQHLHSSNAHLVHHYGNQLALWLMHVLSSAQ